MNHPKRATRVGLAFLFIISLSFSLVARDWEEILESTEIELPPPISFQVQWRTDIMAAFAEARLSNRPVLVTLRCLPCKQCSDFDKEVLDGGSYLDPFLTQFITVRLTDANALDFRVFPVEGFQDLDLSWWGYFMSPEGRVYAIYGGRDEVSDETRISAGSLVTTMGRVLQHHYDPERADWNIDGPAPDWDAIAQPPSALPGFDSWNNATHRSEKTTCIHCHQVADILRAPALDAGEFVNERDTQVWPLPENVGIVLDRDNGLLVKQVLSGSAAETAGLKKNDHLAAAGERKLFGQADFRGVLHRSSPSATRIEIAWIRDGKVMTGALHTEPDWKKTVLDWRMSISQGMIGGYPGFWPLRLNDRRREQLGLKEDQFAVAPYMGKNQTSAVYNAGLRPGHVVVDIDGKIPPNKSGRGFLVWFRFQYNFGDPVTVGYLDENGDRKQITYTLSKNDH